MPDPKRPDYRVLQSTCGAYELLQWDGNTAQPYRGDLRDEKWASFTCTLGFPVMGVWPKSKKGERAADGTDINALCRGKVRKDPNSNPVRGLQPSDGMWPARMHVV